MKTAVIASDYHCSFAVPVSASEAYTNICRVADWWTNNFEGNSQQPGDVFTVRFGETFVTFQLTEAITGEKIVWLVTDCNLNWLADKKEWKDTEIIWEITRNNNATQINMLHAGLTPDADCYDSCEKGWNHFLRDSLYRLLTEGNGMPEIKKE
ncbi:hypothetical protein F5148DRAFT_1153204 [Russula earlei]|uniref:Uncharacterized protein n=1 Tax=Russula earlei TaxID=71964 RepID=A0ACC0TUB4_9AGAM|nr:hypothetical protein F5148DRAFT_1153204 [Russula earlei]